ncbi:hypothetical protein ACPXCO_37280 [Streptomyces cyaneofuscatus]|uniref:hypothetical protein n=1 Tax=Streptomyces cyaneofuscatus TaxID=66883 RepID=UPI003CF56CEB
MTGVLEQYARARGERLTGQPQLDFPAPTSLPRRVQREVRRAMFAAERRPASPSSAAQRVRREPRPPCAVMQPTERRA